MIWFETKKIENIFVCFSSCFACCEKSVRARIRIPKGAPSIVKFYCRVPAIVHNLLSCPLHCKDCRSSFHFLCEMNKYNPERDRILELKLFLKPWELSLTGSKSVCLTEVFKNRYLMALTRPHFLSCRLTNAQAFACTVLCFILRIHFGSILPM